ncbi:hypothetical protein R1A27_28245 [Methylobacterium sp. NMS12]|uniref:hypothetical protein n=1 Tax=Methylobacterium sp. NMS12 TaxID=3079766 RepID=UPI003F885D95
MNGDACTKNFGQQNVREIYDCTQRTFERVMADPAGATINEWVTVVALVGLGLFIIWIVVSVAAIEARR